MSPALNQAVKLNTGASMPVLGIGTWRMSEAEAEAAIPLSFEFGYRHVDTASIYANEAAVGKALRRLGLRREEYSVTTKCWNDDQRAGHDAVLRAFDASMDRLGLEYIDLYLLHWPCKGKYVEAWKAMEKIHASGRAKAIGVSNFLVHHLEELLPTARVVPANNQVELHPRLVQPDLMKFCQARGITQTAWSPLMKGKVNDIPELVQIGACHGKTPVQVALRWNVQHGIVTIPKSVRPERLRENACIFDFELSPEEMRTIDSLDRNERVGAHPDHFTF